MPMLLLLLACTKTPAPPVVAVSEEAAADRIVIAHTNDLHAHFRPQRVSFAEGDIGGVVALSQTLQALDAKWGEDRVLALDAGDLLSGTPMDEYETNGVRAGAMVELLGVVGYDAWTLGNHEFDKGVEHTAAIVKMSSVPVLSANLDGPDGQPAFEGLRDHIVLEAGGKKVGVIGATTPSLTRFLAQGIGDVQVLDAAEHVQASVDALRDEVDVLVALTHIGRDGDKDLALAVPELDLIVGGHSHTRLYEPIKVGDTWIVQAGEYGQGMGVSVLTVGEEVELEYELLHPSEAQAKLPARDEVIAFSDHWRQTLKKDWGMVVGDSEHALGRRGDGETPLGRWVGHVLRKSHGADVGLYNSGGLRADLPKGAVTREELYQIFPFSNEVVVVEVSGGDLLGLALRNARGILAERGVMQQEGLRYTFRERMGSPEIIEVQVNGKRLDPDGTYRIATNTFVLSQWEKYLGSPPKGEGTGTGKTVLDTVEAWLRANPVKEVPPAGGIHLQSPM